MSKLTSILAAVMLMTTPVLAADRTDCRASLSDVILQNESQPDVSDYKVTELSEQTQRVILELRGAPPVEAPYSFALASATVDGEAMGQLLIHDGDCVLLGIGPGPIDKILRFMGIEQAGQ